MNLMAKWTIEAVIRNIFDYSVTIDRVQLGLLESTLLLEDTTIYRKDGLKEELLAKVPLIYLDCEFKSLLKNRIHLTDAVVSCKEIIVTKDAGAFIDHLSADVCQSKGSAARAYLRQTKEREMKIDRLTLSLDQIAFIEHTTKGSFKQRRIDVAIEKVQFTNLSSLQEMRDIIAPLLNITEAATPLMAREGSDSKRE
jgi:hypothetical protein